MTRKISISLAEVKLGMEEAFALGNLDARRDWGFAGDYVRAMHIMLQQGTPNDYVVATGESYSVREFVETAARALGIALYWSGHGVDEVGRDAAGKVIVKIDKRFFRPAEVHSLCGDYSKARKELGWKPQTTFEQMVEMMVRSDFDRLSFSPKRPLATKRTLVGL